jgi:hypothetical protein
LCLYQAAFSCTLLRQTAATARIEKLSSWALISSPQAQDGDCRTNTRRTLPQGATSAGLDGILPTGKKAPQAMIACGLEKYES